MKNTPVTRDLRSLKVRRCIATNWPMDEMADGHLGLGLNGRVSHFRPVKSPGLKLPTHSQMTDDQILKFMILKFVNLMISRDSWAYNASATIARSVRTSWSHTSHELFAPAWSHTSH